VAARTQRRYRVLGALGSGLLSPLLVEPLGQPAERLVLARPADPSLQARLRGVDRGVSLEREVVETDRGRLGVASFVDGVDGTCLPAILPAGAVRAILSAIVEILVETEAFGVHHGALSPDRVRFRPDGRVVLVGFVGGSSDLGALRDLALFWLGADDEAGVADTTWRALLADWPPSLSALAARLGPTDRAPIQAVVAAASPPALLPPPVSVITERGPAFPPKVQLAAISIVMLGLGLGAGVSLYGWRETPAIDVPGAVEVRLDCDPRVVGASRLPWNTPSRCRVEARMSSGATLVGDVDGSTDRGYVCAAAVGGLQCTGR
jgi:hypothetical protein